MRVSNENRDVEYLINVFFEIHPLEGHYCERSTHT